VDVKMKAIDHEWFTYAIWSVFRQT
jgi:hypothetical protein